MGAIELQVFVSLVVILGAAFVALICDFLKGNIEQLRESNIEYRVRQDEREKRDEILEKVQRHTIETLAQARVAPAPVEQPSRAATQAEESRETFERSQRQRAARRRENRQQAPLNTTPEPVEVLPPVAELQPILLRTAATRVIPAVTSLSASTVLPTTDPLLPQAHLSIAEMPAPMEAAIESTEAQVVRIRVLNETEILHLGQPVEPADPDMVTAMSSLEPPNPIAPVQALPPAATLEPIISAEAPPSIPVAQIETISFAAPAPRAFANLEHTAPAESRSNVVSMPVAPVARNPEPVMPAMAELEIPGGFHPAPVLARLLEEEAPFHGLAIVISVVDYVRLMAEQGKPAAEQLMGSISRLVMSLAREQDFACRIAEDEFILLYSHETGAAAKRRIQQVSERLWDFQLRSLGSVSVIFSWGAAESTQDAVVHAVEYAREQMLESRRNRRTLASGVGRFRRRTGND